MELPRLKIGQDVATLMPVYIKDRYTHCLLTGKSGGGKSTSLLGWWAEDNYYGNSKILVDPSGTLSLLCYAISGGNYVSMDNGIALNPMLSPYEPSQICDIVIESVNQMVTQTSPNLPFTVKMVDMLDEAIKNSLKINRRSLFCVLDYIKNMRGSAETKDGIIARLQYLLSDPKMEKLLCGKNSIEWGELIDNKKTLIVDCFGMSRAKFVFTGSLVTNGLKNYFRFIRRKEYKPVSVFVDEFQNFVSPGVSEILAEGRKYNISFCMGTQSFATMDDKMTKQMLNVGNIITYKLAYRDAAIIAKELDIEPQAIQYLEKYHVAYMTTKERGIAKAPYPLFVKEKSAPTSVMVEPQRKSKPSWFTTESYQPT